MRIKTLILALLLNISFTDFANPDIEEWSFVQSTVQAFYMFETLEVDGSVAIGDGCSAADCVGDSPSCYCCQNLGSCDVIGAFYKPYECTNGWSYQGPQNGWSDSYSYCNPDLNAPCGSDSDSEDCQLTDENVCIGWIYVDQEGWTTVPTNGNDGGEYSVKYPSIGADIDFIIYDVSEGRSYDLEAICQDENSDCSWSNFGMFLYGSGDYTLNNGSNIPETYNTLSTYPNPFNPSLTIDFSIESPGFIDISIYDIMGSLVDDIVDNRFMVSGQHSIIWDARNFASGEYLVRFKIDDVVHATKMVAYVK